MRPIRLETLIAAPIGECFRLSLSVSAHVASMRASGEQAIAGVTSGVMKLGDSATWRARHFGIVFRVTSAITEYQPRADSSTSSDTARSGDGGTSTRRYMPHLLRQRNTWLKTALEKSS